MQFIENSEAIYSHSEGDLQSSLQKDLQNDLTSSIDQRYYQGGIPFPLIYFQKVCNGYGECSCGVCKCGIDKDNNVYMGPTCEVCPVSPYITI